MFFADLFLFRDTPYLYARDSSRAPLLIPFFQLAMGTSYGFLVAFFQNNAQIILHGINVEHMPGKIVFGGNIISGILVALIFHGGVTIIVWLMAKGVGGAGNLAMLYRTTAYLLPQALLALPFIASRSVLPGGGFEVLPYSGLYTPLASYALISSIVGLFHIFRVTQQINIQRCAVAVLFTVLFCSAVLML